MKARALRAASVFALSALATLFASEAHAEDKKREKPDYDGRGDPPSGAGRALLWVPRVALAPLYLVSEFVVRRPLGLLIVTAEKNNWPKVITEFFTFDKDKKSGIVPTAFVDFGFLPSVGFYFFSDDFLAKRNDLRIAGSTWGPDWLSGSIMDRVRLDDRGSTTAIRAAYSRRHDWVFAGIGPDTRQENLTRYGANRLEISSVTSVQLARASVLRSEVGFRSVRFDADETCCDDPSIRTGIDRGWFLAPPAYPGGYRGLYSRLDLSWDSRRPRPAPQSGVRVAGEAEYGTNLVGDVGNSWVRYGGQVGAFWDVTGHARVVGLTLTGLLTDPLSGASTGNDVPFTELVNLSAEGLMRGFRPGRLLGRSGAAATLHYEWPIWVWLDGSMHVAVGNVFDGRFKGFEPSKLRISSGIGLRTSNSPDHQFEILAGFGTDTFEQGTAISSFRLVVGATRGF